MLKPTLSIIKEGKTPPDARVAFTPLQCKQLIKEGWQIKVQSCSHRCYSDAEYKNQGVPVVDDVSDADILLGIKEVPPYQLIEGKTYFFFSHTIKKQAHNQKLLKTGLGKHITLIDYEVLTDDQGERLIAFGRFAGIVGAHNALYTFYKRTGTVDMPRMFSFQHYTDAKDYYKKIQTPAIKIVLTGKGRVANGAADVLKDMGFVKIEPLDFITKNYDFGVFAQIDCNDYVIKKDKTSFDKSEYYSHPDRFDMDFMKYLSVADIFINGIYWDKQSPAFFELSDLNSKEFHTRVIADITCDIAPESSVPVTIRASTITDPVFGYDLIKMQECKPYTADSIDIMAIDNLPNELPRDASESFGEKFISSILPELLKERSKILEKATIVKAGNLTPGFTYLTDYVHADFEHISK